MDDETFPTEWRHKDVRARGEAEVGLFKKTNRHTSSLIRDAAHSIALCPLESLWTPLEAISPPAQLGLSGEG